MCVSIYIHRSCPANLVTLLFNWQEGRCFHSFIMKATKDHTCALCTKTHSNSKIGEKGEKIWSGAPYFCFFRPSPPPSCFHVCLPWVGGWVVFVLRSRLFMYPKINETSRHVNELTATTILARSFASWTLERLLKMEHKATFY